MRESSIEKITSQPVVHISDYVDPSTDPGGATGAVVVIDTQDGSPNDGDVPTFVAGTPDKFKPMPGGSGSMVPTYIAPGQAYSVPANRQITYAIPIDNEGTLDTEGYLILVD